MSVTKILRRGTTFDQPVALKYQQNRVTVAILYD